MFALEIGFLDGVSQPETLLVRRPHAIIGSSEFANVVVDDMRELPYQIRVIREMGRRFRTKPILNGTDPVPLPPGIDGVYEGSVQLNLGAVRLMITALDIDLAQRDNEPADRAGIRALRQSAAVVSPRFPAVVVRGSIPVVVSFSPDQPIFIGRSNRCAVRLDVSDVSMTHARLGFEGRQFWIEDLGSTNGTWVHDQQISGRISVQAGTSVMIGRETSIVGVTTEEELAAATRSSVDTPKTRVAATTYPLVVSVSELVRPARVSVSSGGQITIGRDPGNDIWIGAPHVSRRHCTVSLSEGGALRITDSSTNGTGYPGGLLRSGESMDLAGQPTVLDFGGGVTIAVCLTEDDERAFTSAQGAASAFARTNASAVALTRRASGLESGKKKEVTGGRRALNETIAQIRHPRALAQGFVRMFREAGPFGQALFLVCAVLMVLVVAVVVSLLVPVIFR